MQVWEIFIIGVALAMDAVATSLANGMAEPRMKAVKMVFMAGAFGLFQFGMPLIGFALGMALSSLVEAAAPYIAFALLAFIGGRMLLDAFQSQEDKEEEDLSCLSNGKVCLLAIATSIDALAVGVGGSLMGMDPLVSCAVIGVTAFALSFLGAVVGHMLGKRFNTWAQAAGGVVLVVIGLKFLLERLFG